MKSDPQSVILVSLLASGGLLTIRALREGKLSPRAYVALIVVGLMLVVLGGFAPELAAAFAVLVFVGVFLARGTDLEALLTRKRAA